MIVCMSLLLRDNRCVRCNHVYYSFCCKQWSGQWTVVKVSDLIFANIYLYTTSCRRAAATVCPRPSPPPWAPKRLLPPSRWQHSSSFSRPTCSHAHHCSRLTRQHGGEQSTLPLSALTLLVRQQEVHLACQSCCCCCFVFVLL